MTRKRTSGFTLIELLVVMAIIAILGALVAAGIMSWTSGQARRNSEAHIRSVYMAVMRQWDAVISDAKKESLPAGVTDRNTWIRMRLIEAFPATFAEVTTGYGAAGQLTLIPAARRKYMANYQKAIGTLTARPSESAACLYLAMSLDRSGSGYNIDSLKAFIKDSNGDKLNEFVDGWGQPLYFYRFASSTELTASRPPNVTYLDATVPVLLSAGADGLLGHNLPTIAVPQQDLSITNLKDADDNLYSFKLK
ncbi:MAG: type II secretion system protein [Planctomycetota bacterium]